MVKGAGLGKGRTGFKSLSAIKLTVGVLGRSDLLCRVLVRIKEEKELASMEEGSSFLKRKQMEE